MTEEELANINGDVIAAFWKYVQTLPFTIGDDVGDYGPWLEFFVGGVEYGQCN